MQSVLIIMLSIIGVIAYSWFVCNTAIYSKREDEFEEFEEHVQDLIEITGGKN